MMSGSIEGEGQLTSLAVVLPLALAGFVIASGCWTLFAVAGAHVRIELSLGSFEFGLLLAMPMAVSALLAIPAGLTAQRIGARTVMLACLAGLAICMGILLVATSYPGYLVAAGGLGLAGGFYCAGLQFVTSHCRARRLGLILGVFGSGITGTGLNYYLVPLIHEAYVWKGAALAYLVVLLLVLLLMLMLTSAEDAEPGSRKPTGIGTLVRHAWLNQRWQLCAFFGVVAGSFFSLALWLPDYLTSQFHLTVQAGAQLAQWFVIPGALAQILGGALSDRFGSSRITSRALATGLLPLIVLSYPPMTLFIQGIDATLQLEFALPLLMAVFFIVTLGIALGCAMGSLQRLVILDNSQAAAFFAGLLLVTACTVAFLLPVLFSAVTDGLQIPSAVFMILFALLAACLWLFVKARRQHERKTLLHRSVSPTYHQ
ncbi:MAG: MFS transporter [Leeuwenhoekiella sp.]|nr:MAG: MFS transporter [Leeuwenhoekiella sp.]